MSIINDKAVQSILLLLSSFIASLPQWPVEDIMNWVDLVIKILQLMTVAGGVVMGAIKARHYLKERAHNKPKTPKQ